MSTNTFALMPTTVFVAGSGAGNYVSSGASGSLQDIDAVFAVTRAVPVGWKVTIEFCGDGLVSVNTGTIALVIDGAMVNSQIVQTTSSWSGFAVKWVFSGDGASHTFKPQFVGGVGWTCSIINDTSTRKPTFYFKMEPSL